ncbi:M56 family metallopeptidase [Mucilaginibacter ginsenosidivorans]|uniref:M56 family metallopeptidase n=1 Tax=Mucilaginibacter ginsenosidivorans TaxID=398053 RepID=A0A5B8V1S6_9SPHI|nr:M56 family metallopeptidase [Mucilaginibacter ginsenosidivorans]QEC64516.1 M56 family metallopeptidase [Mucilaginibacter ginsenosidivorans]
MIPYILHVALLISISLLFYKIFLQRETFYKLNRVILLVCLGLSFTLPLITIPEAWTLRSEPGRAALKAQVQQTPEMAVLIKAEVQKQVLAAQKQAQQQAKKQPVVKHEAAKVQAAPTVTAAGEPQSIIAEQAKPVWPIVIKWLFYIYWAGVGAFGLNLLLQVIVLLYRAYSNPVILDGKFRIIEVTGDKAPCSFGNNIFINPEKYDWDTYNQILLHEKVHIQQGHSADILLAELVLVFQWFNPFAWLYRGELENNLEFLTDETVLGHNPVEKESYQMSLLKVSVPHLALSVTTNYNQSLLKKRIVMMNVKRSNIHTMWKYFILLPLMAGLACALNQTAFSQGKAKTKSKATVSRNQSFHQNWGSRDMSQGTWFATIKGEKVRIEFRNDDDDHNWSNSDSFLLSEFSSLPKDTKGDFTLKRDAGTVLFNGKFDGNDGYGHYKFTADKGFTDYLKSEGITGIEENDQFAFFIINIKRDYVAMLKANGYTHLGKNDLVSMGALKVDEPFIKFWKQEGYMHMSPNELVSAKALGINKEYVHEIREAGYKDVDFNQLTSFKALGIDGKYIASLKKANAKFAKNGNENEMPRAEDITSFKAMNIDSAYVRDIKEAGYTNVPINELTSMKAVGVTSDYAKSLAALGYKNISANELVSLRSLGITPEYIKGVNDMGYKNISANELMSFKSLGVNADFIKSFNDIGYKDLSPNDLTSLKALGIKPDFIKGFEDMGYKNISINELSSLKALNVNAEFIKSFEAVGYKQIPINELSSLKSLGVTPGFIKGFKDIGFTNVSLNDVTSLKALGVTPAFIKGFKDIGFTNISLNDATSMKATGVTPEYIKEMKAKGFNSKDLNKYIQLKNAFN